MSNPYAPPDDRPRGDEAPVDRGPAPERQTGTPSGAPDGRAGDGQSPAPWPMGNPGASAGSPVPQAPPPVNPAVLGGPLPANDGRADHLRARLATRPDGTLVVTPYDRQDSSMLRLLTEADALVLRDPHAPALPAGASVSAIRLDTLGI